MRLLSACASDPRLRPAWQDELQLLCGQLDRHISTHVRESPQAMHRTRLKDLATQTYVRWQELLSRCQPKVPLNPQGGSEGSGWAGLARVSSMSTLTSTPTAGQLLCPWPEEGAGPGEGLGILNKNPVPGWSGEGTGTLRIQAGLLLASEGRFRLLCSPLIARATFSITPHFLRPA